MFYCVVEYFSFFAPGYLVVTNPSSEPQEYFDLDVHFRRTIWLPCGLSTPERSEGGEVLKIAVRDDKCCGGATILAAATILAGAEVIQGDHLRGSGAGGPAVP